MSSPFMTTILSSSGGSGGSSILSFAFLPLILLGMYFLMIRPQRKRMREQQLLQESIAVGQEVVTTSGIFGKITGEDGDSRFWLEIDDDVQIRIARAAVQSVVVASNDDDESSDSEPGSDDDDSGSDDVATDSADASTSSED